MTDSELLDKMSDAWAPEYRLRRYRPYFGSTTLAPLFGDSGRKCVQEAERAHNGDDLLDHSRAFKPIGSGSSRAVVMVSAPYEDALRRFIGSKKQIVEEIYALADARDLRVRIGHPTDRVYDSTPRGRYPVLPIVWWDSARFTLTYPPVPTPVIDGDEEN